jgi:hypothetical protein
LRNRNCHRDGVEPPDGGPGSYRIVDENGTVVDGDRPTLTAALLSTSRTTASTN